MKCPNNMFSFAISFNLYYHTMLYFLKSKRILISALGFFVTFLFKIYFEFYFSKDLILWHNSWVFPDEQFPQHISETVHTLTIDVGRSLISY